jgi:hypothetical protein
MAKQSRKQSRKHRERHNKTRSQRGGNVGAYPPSAWGFTMANLGNGWDQFMRSLSVQPGGVNHSNQLVPVNGGTNIPKMAQTGGKRRCKKGKKGKRGGNMLAVAEQAAVPFALVAMNNALGSRRNRSNNKSRRRR